MKVGPYRKRYTQIKPMSLGTVTRAVVWGFGGEHGMCS